MKIIPVTSNILTAQPAFTQIKNESLQEKILSEWQLNFENKKEGNTNMVNISEDKQTNINQFISEFKACNDPKAFFSCLFKKMISLKKSEKENFITGTMQTIQSPENPELNHLKEKFNKALHRYMSVSLMNSPLTEQFSNNMNKYSLEGDDDDISLI